MVSSRQRYNRLVQALGQAGYRLTPQREAVLHVLAETPEHPSVVRIHELARRRCRSTSRATVYNTVRVLKQLGALEELQYGGMAHRYVVQSLTPHAHLVCVRCQRIEDFASAELWGELEAAGARSGYRVLAYHVAFYGECPACQQAAAGPGAQPPGGEVIPEREYAREPPRGVPRPGHERSGSMGGTTDG